MHRIFRLSLTISEPLFISSRCLSLTSTSCKWNHIRYSQNLDLGRQAFQVFAVKTMIDQYPDLSANDMNDVANGLTNENHIQSKLKNLDLFKSAEDSSDILAKLGELTRKDDQSSLSEIYDKINKNCLSTLSSEDTKTLIKSQHPRFLLRHFCDSADITVYLSSTRHDNGYYHTSVFFEKDIVCTAKHEVKEEAEHLACLLTIKNKFQKQFNDIDIKEFELPLERDVDLRTEHRQRNINILKSAEESFGFTIRGGEQKVIRNKQYVQLNIITPVFISHITENSPAETHGLRVGDVLLGVNDHSLKDKTHQQAVVTLQKFINHEEALFTVIYNKHEKLKYEAEQKILERELVKTKDEIKSRRFGKWHESKSKVDPQEYFLEKFVEKKRKFVAKKGGNINRLWHQYR